MSTLLFLKGLEKAKKYLEYHYTGRAMYPEFFIDWDPTTTQFRDIYDSLSVLQSNNYNTNMFRLESITNFTKLLWNFQSYSPE